MDTVLSYSCYNKYKQVDYVFIEEMFIYDSQIWYEKQVMGLFKLLKKPQLSF